MTVLITTIPKSGTHLLRQIIGPHRWAPIIQGTSAIALLEPCGVSTTRRPVGRDLGKFLEGIDKHPTSITMGHIPYHPGAVEAIKTRGIPVVQLIRDPRDMVVAHCASVTRKDGKAMRMFDFHFSDGLRLSEKDDPLIWCIRLALFWWKGWLPWIEKEASNLVIRFEDLVGPNQRETIAAIGSILGPDFSVDDAIARIKPESATFRKGLVGEWRKEFGPHHMRLFDDTMGPTMETLGYG